MYPQLVFSNLFNRKRPARRKRPRPNLRFEKLEDRVLLAADCYANLFAGPRLADMDSNESEVLEGVFNALLPGSHVDLTVADWNAVGDGNISVNALLTELQADLGVSSPEQALNADVTLGQIFDAAADVIPADGETADLHAALLDLEDDVTVSELNDTIQLDDILQVRFPDGSFADVELNALNLVTGAIQLYNYDNVATTNDPVTLSGTLFNDPNVNSIELWAQVIEPPIIDPVVYAGDQFYSAAMRLKMNVDLVDFTAPLDSSVTISDMELYVDVARAQGEVTEVHSTSEPGPAVTVQASHGVANMYMGEISDSLFFNRTHVIDPADLDFGTIGSVTGPLGTLLDVEARGYAEGTAPFSTALEFFGPFPESQTTGTSATFIDNAVDDLLQSLEAQVTLAGVVVNDPTGDIGNIVADAIHEPLVGVLTNVGDPALDYLGTGIGEMDVTINHVNCPPVAVDDTVITPEDTPIAIDILANDFDVEGGDIDPATVSIIDGPEHGTLSVDPVTGIVTYSPDQDYNGPDGFKYTVDDTEGAESNVATVDITVTPVPDPPEAVDDAYETNEDTALEILDPGVLGNDFDVDGDPLTAVFVDGPSNGTVSLSSDGSFEYTPDPNFNGIDTFTYKANDGQFDSNVATVTITVLPVPDPPEAVDDAYSTDEDVPLTVQAPGVLANDSDVDGDSLTSILVSGANNGEVSLNDDGSFTYTPNANFNGQDSFTYQANDGELNSNVATVTIDVTPINDPPAAADDSYSTQEDTTLSISTPGVLANDSDVEGDDLSSMLVDGPSDGTLSLNSDGSFDYTPNANFNGIDTFTYKANDGDLNSNVATVSINVIPVNDAPVAADDSYVTDEDTPLTVSAPGILGNDSDVDGDSLSSVLVSGPANGTLSLAPDGSFTYTPDANFNGSDSFTYKANDGSANSNIATVNITVLPVNDAPVAADDNYTTSEDSPLTVADPGVLINDSDVDGDPLSAALVDGPSDGTLTLNPDGSFTYTPDADFNGNDSFTYKADDGSADSNVATVSITVTPVNDAPVANDDNYNTQEDTPLTVSGPGVLGNDSDADGDPLSASLVSGPGHGTVTLNDDGSFTYTPDENYNGPDSFTYQANDGQVDSNVATVDITVDSVNDAPVAANDSYSTDEDTTLTVSSPGVLANDDDVDGDALTSILVGDPSHGTVSLNADGSFSYTPDPDYSGPDSFTYKANDGTSDSNIATVSITVNPINDPPVAVDDAYTTEQNLTLTVAGPGVQANDSDIDSDTLTSLLVSGPSDGTVTLNADGSFTYTPDHNFVGDDSFTYRDNDGSADSNVATVAITVTPQQADLSLDMTVDDPTPNVGGKVVFTITVDNGGPTRATGVAVSDSLPADMTFESSSASQGSYDPGAGTWTIGTMENGGSATLQITATVNETGTISNTAQVSASDAQDPDSTPGNNDPLEDDQDSETIEVQVAGAQITHTNTTVGDYLDGDGDDLEEIEYGVRKDEIGNVAPGVFFYYVSVEAPSSDFTDFVDQSENHATFDTLFDVHNDQVRLYDENGFTTSIGTVAIADGDVTIDVAGATLGDVYTVQVKWNPDTVKGQSAPDPSTVSYLFATSVDSNFVSQDGVDLVKKGSAMVAASGSTATSHVESSHLHLDSADDLLGGNHTVFVGIDNALQHDRVLDAIAAINAHVSQHGTSLTEVTAAAEADIRLTTSATSFMGGVSEGILGFSDVSGDVTLIEGWNWYAGADASAIGSTQFDFQTVATHELLHGLGIEHHTEVGSVMHGELSPGDVYRLSGSGHPEAAGDAHQTLAEMQNLLPWLNATDGLLRRVDARSGRSPVGSEPLAASKSQRLEALDHVLSQLADSEDEPDEFGSYKPAREDDPDWPSLVDALLSEEQETADKLFAEL